MLTGSASLGRKLCLPLLVAVTLLCFPHPGHTVGFRNIGLSASGVGIANALGADAEHTSSMAYNPAALAFQSGGAVALGGMRTFGDLEQSGETGKPKRRLLPNSLYLTYSGLGTPWGFGLAANRPFHMDSDFGGDLKGPNAATRTELDLIDLNPTVAYRLRPNWAVAVGGHYYYAKDFEYSTNAVTRTGDGGGFGGSVGLMYWREQWSAALTYISSATLGLEGRNLDNDFQLPSRIRLGLKYRYDLNLSLHLDVVQTRWSDFKGLEGAETKKNWDNVFGFRFGGMYRLSDRLRVRAGYAFDSGPKDDRTFDPRSPSGTRHLATLGGGWDSGPLQLNLGFAFGLHLAREVDGAEVPAYNGEHQTSAYYALGNVVYSF